MHMPLRRAILWIVLSVVVVSGSTAVALIYLNHIKRMYTTDPAYHIVAIVQSTPTAEMLQTVYLAELLELSLDIPKNLYTFSSREGEKKLLKSPLIKKASLHKLRPGTVYVDYEVRKPVAFLSNYSNTVMDEEGYIFPFKPFFTPKKLPEVTLSPEGTPLTEVDWGTKLHGKELTLALALLKEMQQTFGRDSSSIARIDVSKAYASSCGQQQIVLILEEQYSCKKEGRLQVETFPVILRLHTEEYQEGLANYAALVPLIKKKKGEVGQGVEERPFVADLRLSQLAFISERVYTTF